MASKNLSYGTMTAETANGPVILHSGQGTTYCPFCDKPTPSRGLNCKKCGEKRDAHKTIDHYVLKSPKTNKSICPACKRGTPTGNLVCQNDGCYHVRKEVAENTSKPTKPAQTSKGAKTTDNSGIVQLAETVSSLDKEVKSLKDQLAAERTERGIEREGRLEERRRRTTTESKLDQANITIARIRRELDQANNRANQEAKGRVRAEKELAKKCEILGWVSNKAAQHA